MKQSLSESEEKVKQAADTEQSLRKELQTLQGHLQASKTAELECTKKLCEALLKLEKLSNKSSKPSGRAGLAARTSSHQGCKTSLQRQVLSLISLSLSRSKRPPLWTGQSHLHTLDTTAAKSDCFASRHRHRLGEDQHVANAPRSQLQDQDWMIAQGPPKNPREAEPLCRRWSCHLLVDSGATLGHNCPLPNGNSALDGGCIPFSIVMCVLQ